MRKSYIGIAILASIIGLMMLFAPAEWTKVTVIILGIAAIINGIYNLKTVKNLVDNDGYQKIIKIRGITSLIVGAIAILLPLILAGLLWTVMLYVLAVYLLLSAGSELYAMTKMKEVDISTKPYMYEVFFSIALAIILFIMPATIGLILVRIVGVLILLLSIGFIIREWKNKTLIIYPEPVPDEKTDTDSTTNTTN